MIKSIIPKAAKQELFCQKYWQKMGARLTSEKRRYDVPSLFDYSYHNYNVLGISPCDHKLLGELDASFKVSELSKEKITVWRGVSNPSYFYPDNQQIGNYFEKCKNIQPGETLYMVEFPYITNSKDYATSFISNFSKATNLLFEIEIPKGTPLPFDSNRTVLQRCSKFVCTDTQKVKDNRKTYQHIKLKLLPRDVKYDNTQKENGVSKLLNRSIITQGKDWLLKLKKSLFEK